MDPTLILIRSLHIAIAAGWFAVPLAAVSTLRLGTRHGAPALADAARMAERRWTAASVMGLLTLLTGLWAVFYLGGFRFVPHTMHAALGLVLIMIAVCFFGLRRLSKRLCTLAQGGAAESPAVTALLKRMSMGSGIVQALWVTVLVLMVWR